MAKEDVKRYLQAMHGMQTGVAYDQEKGSGDGSPKHLRVGINARAVDHKALVKLLMDAGIITLDAYEKALADAMEEERDRYAKHLSERFGATITLA